MIRFLIVLLFTLVTAYPQAEDAVKMKGVKINLLSEADAISPGANFTIAIHLQHYDGFHTYWKNPGLVGVATQIVWTLPEGFQAGETKWQVPERSKMLKLNCHGYKGETYLLVDIQAGKVVPETFDIQAQISGMSCSEKSCCFVGFANTKISLKKSEHLVINPENQKIITAAKKRLPQLQKHWHSSFTQSEKEILLQVINKHFTKNIPKDLYFFPEQNIYNTEIPQKISVDNKANIQLRFQTHDSAGKNLQSITGFLYNPQGWSSEKEKYLRIEAKVAVD